MPLPSLRCKRICPAHLRQLHLRLYLLLLQLAAQLLLPLGYLVQRDLLLQCAILQLLILQHQVLNLIVQLLEDQLVLLHQEAHLLL